MSKNTYPISFSFPEEKIISNIPINKIYDFSPLIPGDKTTYIYKTEEDYYDQYQKSFYAITFKKVGWDCMRHYEILANGCLPYFIDINDIPDKTMCNFPKDLVIEGMNLDGVDYINRTIDHNKFDKSKYFDIIRRLLDYTRTYLTTIYSAKYILTTINNLQNNPRILYINCGGRNNYYLRSMMLHGLRTLFGSNVVDYKKCDYIYNTYQNKRARDMYGKGFSYTRLLKDIEIDRTNVLDKIKNKYFDLIIFTALHQYECEYHDLIRENYPSNKLIYLCGDDCHMKCKIYDKDSHYFIRELGSIKK